MSITLYSKYRRMNLRNAWNLSGMTQTVAYVSAGLLAFLLAYVLLAWVDHSIEEAERIGKQSQASHTERYEKVLLSCLNGQGMAIDGVVHTCKPYSIHLDMNNKGL